MTQPDLNPTESAAREHESRVLESFYVAGAAKTKDIKIAKTYLSSNDTNYSRTLDAAYTSTENITTAASNSVRAAGSLFGNCSAALSRAGSWIGEVAASSVGTVLKRVGLPLLAAVKGASAVEAISSHDGHALAKAGGSFLGSVLAGVAGGAAIGSIGGITALPGGLIGGALAAVGYIGVMYYSDDFGGAAADSLLGDTLQAQQDNRIRGKIVNEQTRIRKIEAKSSGESLNLGDRASLGQHEQALKELYTLRAGVSVPASDIQGSFNKERDLETIAKEMNSIKRFCAENKDALQRPIPLHTPGLAETQKDSFGEVKTPLPPTLAIKSMPGQNLRGS